MTELDPELVSLLYRTPPEALEHKVLEHVRVSSKQVKGQTAYVVSDLRGNFIVSIPFRVWRGEGPMSSTPAQIIASTLLRSIICGDCGERLIEGESGICTPCEARQVGDLRRIASDLRRMHHTD